MGGGCAAAAFGASCRQRATAAPSPHPSHPPARPQIYFGSSLAVVAAFAAALVQHHYGPGADEVGGREDGSLTFRVFALW